MFKKKLSEDSFTNLIALDSKISGNIVFSGTLRIDGDVNGNVTCSSEDTSTENSVVVGRDGTVSGAKIITPNAVLGGLISVAELRVEGTLRIKSTAKIKKALIYYRNLEIETGAVLDNCQMKHLDHCSEGEEI